MLPPSPATPVSLASHTRSSGRLLGAGLLTMTLAVAAAGLTLLPRAGRPVAILTSTATSLVAAIGAAGGTVLAAPSAHVIVAMPGDLSFVPRLRQLGYLFVLDADAAAACGMVQSADGKSNAE